MVLKSALCSLQWQQLTWRALATVQSLTLWHNTYLVVLGVQSVDDSLSFLGAAAVLHRTEAQGHYCQLSDNRTRGGQEAARAHLHIYECCVWWWRRSWPARCSVAGPQAERTGSCQRPSRRRSAARDASGSTTGCSVWERPSRTPGVRRGSTEWTEPNRTEAKRQTSPQQWWSRFCPEVSLPPPSLPIPGDENRLMHVRFCTSSPFPCNVSALNSRRSAAGWSDVSSSRVCEPRRSSCSEARCGRAPGRSGSRAAAAGRGRWRPSSQNAVLEHNQTFAHLSSSKTQCK